MALANKLRKLPSEIEEEPLKNIIRLTEYYRYTESRKG